MPECSILTISLPPGHCRMEAGSRGLVGVAFCTPDEAYEGSSGLSGAAGELLEEAGRQLRAYFDGRLREFELPLDLSGRTEFQRRVLQGCLGIGYGELLTYGELAWRSGYPGAARAVGQVMATNRLALVIPCHRVVGSGGRLTGYGYGLELKRRLLEMERTQAGWEAIGDPSNGVGLAAGRR